MLKHLYKLTLLAILLMPVSLKAQDDIALDAYGPEQADTVEILSTKMGRLIKNTIILPSQYFEDESSNVLYPVIYLLNGHGGGYSSWGLIRPDLDYIASELGAIIVCPDGENSWYWDSPINPSSQFETYVSTELVGYIDDNYRTIRDPRMRAITGYSMGGHGSLWLAMRHPDTFGICCSMSGGVNIIPFPENWNMKDAIGEYETNKDAWRSHTVISLVKEDMCPAGLKIMFDCGTEDFFLDVNRELHETMLEKKIPHDYVERPGAHDADYWNNALDYHLLFIQKAFDEIENTAE